MKRFSCTLSALMLAMIIPVMVMNADDIEKNAQNTENGKDSEMIAKVNGEIVTLGEVNGEIDNMMAQMGGQIPPAQLEQLKPQMKKQAVENLINQKLLLQIAEENKITAPESEVDQALVKIKNQFPSEDAFEQRIKQLSMTKATIKEDIQKNLKIQKLLAEELKDVKNPTDSEIKTYYESNSEQFEIPEQIKASHILLKTEPGMDEAEKAQKRLELAKLKGEIEGGANFAEMAKTHSDCPSSQKGGDLGFFGRGQMVKEFENTAFEMEVGEISDVVETQFGYHIIKLTGHKDGQTMPFTDVEDRISNILLQKQKENEISSYLDSLRNDATIEYAETQ